MSKVRYGFIGAGAIAHVAAKSVQGKDNSCVVAVSDPNSERTKDLCDAFEIPKSYENAEDLLADADVDAVYIAVPNKFHAPLSIQSLEAGKHTLLDKPFALNINEANDVAKAAAASGKLFMLGMNQRYREDSQKIRSLVQQGVFGEIYHAKAYWQRRQGIPRLGTWFGSKALAGGGGLLDIGVHLLDLCLHTAGNFDAVSVAGATYTKFGNRGLGEGGWGSSDREDIVFDVDDFASAFIRFADGMTVTLDITWACHAEDPNRMNVNLYGTEAGASLYPAKVFRQDPLRADYDVIDNVKADILWPHGDRFVNFTRAVLGEEEPGVKIEEALAIQKILDGIYASSESGKEVVL